MENVGEQGEKEQRRRNKPETPKKQDQKSVKVVMFVPYTPYSELAKKLRETEKKLECGRERCMLCSTKVRTGKLKKQDCKKRSLVY